MPSNTPLLEKKAVSSPVKKVVCLVRVIFTYSLASERLIENVFVLIR